MKVFVINRHLSLETIRKDKGRLCQDEIGAALAFYVCQGKTEKELSLTQCNQIPGSLLTHYLTIPTAEALTKSRTIIERDAEKTCEFLAINRLISAKIKPECIEAIQRGKKKF